MIKISELPAASALGGTEVVASVQSSTTVKVLVSAIGTYVRGLFTATPATIAEGGTGVASAGAARTALGLAIGSDVQAYDADIPTSAASQAEMEAGTEAALRSMSPLRVAQAIAALASSTPAAGAVVKVARAQVVTSTTGTTDMVYDDTIPQNTEGDEFLTCSITPSYASSKLLIEADLWGGEESNTSTTVIMAALFRDSTADAICASAMPSISSPEFGASIEAGFLHLSVWVDAVAASATVFKLRAGLAGSGTASAFRLNGANGARKFGGVLVTSITVTEIKQ